ncbi:IS1182 family transposase [Methylocystis rosea]|uniref:IS1182 family transposase n=1 Tax=Methylocystis rosea TaxID=173366 RepID=A0A3G8MCI0_9HYPH|nr:IS1182 family transposase [Methylocystis rosea]AZG78900.1 IS1182 family transposase [Methylocystis rosea]
MTHISGFERSQLLLLPEAIDDYVGGCNPVRFIDAFVDGLDLKAVGFERVEAKATGRPGYAPADLLKLYIYGYLNRVRSSRRLEAECHRNIEVIWLLRSLKPDFKTIADFRSANRAAFKKVFREFVILCRRLDLFGRELLAVDGTRIKAVNNKDRNFTTGSLQKFIAAADKKLEDYLKRLDAGDAEDRATTGSRVKNLAEKIEALNKKRGEYAAHLAALEKSGESQVSLTDPDSRAMAAYTKVGVGYNIQIAVDAKHKMIVEQAVSNDVLDMGLLQRTAEPAREILDVEKIDVVADKGYFRTEDIASCEEAGLTPYVPRPQRGPAVNNGFFRKDEFRYDAARNAYVCPAGQELTPIREGKLRDLKKVDYGNAQACRACALRPRCTKDVRSVSRLENEDALDRMAARLKARPEVLDRRRETVEHPFGAIKQWMNQGAFLMRGLEKVRAEFSLTALAYNLRRALNILGMEGLMAAVAA